MQMTEVSLHHLQPPLLLRLLCANDRGVPVILLPPLLLRMQCANDRGALAILLSFLLLRMQYANDRGVPASPPTTPAAQIRVCK